MQLSWLDSAGRAPATKPAPVVKWAGGKTRVLPQLLPLLPPASGPMRHVEPFAGGAAMFFARRPKRALLCDANQHLVATYIAIRDHVDQVIEKLHVLAQEHTTERYYELRETFNKATLSDQERAALFIYLNKTCFNGIYRVNKHGEFNVPAGRYEAPRILDESGLRVASIDLQGIDVRCQRFDDILEDVGPGDFIYLDPPYEPLSDTANFTAYAQAGFTRDDQGRLRKVFGDLDRLGCKLMLSNSDVPFIRELYTGYRTDQITAHRSISCKGKSRGQVTELVVRNY